MRLLPDQLESIDKVRESMKRGRRAVLLQGATGSGKSIMATGLIQSALGKGKTAVFVVPRRELVRQMAETFNNFGLPYSYIAAGYHCNPFARLHIATSGSLIGRLDRIQAPNLAFIDETQYGGAALDTIIKHYKAAGTYVIGLSATPWKLSGQGLGCWYDDMVTGPSIRWLIDNKRLADYRAFSPSSPDLSGIKTVGGDYAQGQLAERMEDDRVLIGNAVEHYKKYAMGKLGVTFGVGIRHSNMLAQAYRDAGVPAMHIDGNTPEDERKRIVVAFAKRELLQLCNAELLGFGYDLASASGIAGVNIQVISGCRPTKSLAKIMQEWGRGLRYDPEPHMFFDHANNFRTHGLPCDDREWTLEDREKKSGGEERSVPIRQCEKCFAVFRPAPLCPRCGYVFPVQYREIEEVDGELAEIDRAAKEAGKKAMRQEVGRIRTQDDAEKIADERGYHWGWVKKMCQIKNIRYVPRTLREARRRRGRP